MKVTLKDDVEVGHAWINEDDGKVKNEVFSAKKGEVLDAEQMSVGDAGRLLARLVKLGYAEQV